ncbi:MAG: Two-component response regulator yesN [Paenibacillus sp.]|jgi:AraC-like DNA-binding protein|nr:Two-component response regulator yesN [Paenibacillus sp.]
MDWNKTVLSERIKPIWNDKVESYFQQMPIFLSKEIVPAHQKSLHIQRGLEINVSHHGRAAVVIGPHVYMQSSKQLILFPGCVPHQVFPESSAMYTRSVLCLDDELVRTAIDDDRLGMLTSTLSALHVHLHAETYAKLSVLLQKMMDEIRGQKTGWKRMIHACLQELSVLLQRNEEYPMSVSELKRASNEAAVSDYVRICCEYIETHLDEELSLQQMAKYCYISPEHLIRSFRKEKGLTYYQYVLFQRVKASKEQLARRPDLSVTEIAGRLGFASSTQFGRAFKSITQMTPSQYRRQFTHDRQAEINLL